MCRVQIVRLALLAVSPPSPPSLIRFFLISSSFLLYLQQYPQSVGSLYLPLQFRLLRCIFSLALLNRCKFISFLVYCCFFHLTLSFSKAIGPFLTLPGPRNLPVGSHQIFLWLSSTWETTFWCKNCSHVFFMCLTIIMFCAGFCPIFSVMLSL